MSGLAFITTLYARFALALWRTRLPSTRQPRYGRYEVFCSTFSTHLDRVIVITSHLSLSALPHKYKTPSEKRTLSAVFMAIELSQEAAASTNTQRTPCFRCFLQDVRLTSIREQRIIWLSNFPRYTSFAPRTGRVERRGSENRTPLYWLATTVHHGSQVIYTLTDYSSFRGTISRKVEIDKQDRSRHEDLCHS